MEHPQTVIFFFFFGRFGNVLCGWDRGVTGDLPHTGVPCALNGYLQKGRLPYIMLLGRVSQC